MDWQQRFESALEYIESNLGGDVSIDEAARRANCSSFHFQRIFGIVCNVTLGEYIRRRRLSLAAQQLSSSVEVGSDTDRVIDIAMRSGYDSADAFARAFRREFGCSPSEARRSGTRLKVYPPLKFSVVLRGGFPMEYRIEPGPAWRMTGIPIEVYCGDNQQSVKIGEFWNSIMADGRFGALAARATKDSLAVCGVVKEMNYDTSMVTYCIAIETPPDRAGLPADCIDFDIPASTWAKFRSHGPIAPNFVQMIPRIFSEWLPSSGWNHAGTPEIELYPEGDTAGGDYWCEYWLPLVNPARS